MKYKTQTKRIAQILETSAGKQPNTKFDDDIKRIADALEYMKDHGGSIGGGGCNCAEILKNYYDKNEIDEILIDLMRSKPVILNVNHITIDEGDTFDPMDGVQALDHEGDDITNLVIVTGTVDTDTPGDYTLTYSVTDDKGKNTEVDRVVTVAEWKAENYATVLFSDGHLMINEKKKNRDADVAVHGAVTNEYIPWDKNNPDTSYVFTSASQRPWDNRKTDIKTVSAGSFFKPSFTSWMFYGCSNLTALDVSNWDTSALTNTNSMFRGCSSLTTPDVSNWDTSALTNTNSMFHGCSNLTALDVSSWDTSAMTNAPYMFYGCSNLTALDVSNWDTSALTNTNCMFRNSAGLTTLDVSSWDTSALTDTGHMFRDCAGLTTIFASDRFVTSQVSSSSNMFTSCSKLVGGAGTTYDSTKIDKTYARIDNPPSAPGYFTAKP